MERRIVIKRAFAQAALVHIALSKPPPAHAARVRVWGSLRLLFRGDRRVARGKVASAVAIGVRHDVEFGAPAHG